MRPVKPAEPPYRADPGGSPWPVLLLALAVLLTILLLGWLT